MKTQICARCGIYPAVVFITKVENGETKNEGICIKCARELHIKPIDDIMEKMGLTEDDIDNLSGEMMTAMDSLEGLFPTEDGDGSDEDGHTATFPFLQNLGFSQSGETPPGPSNEPGYSTKGVPPKKEPKAPPKRNQGMKFLDNYTINLTKKAVEGKLDTMIGREEELERVVQILNRRQKNNPCLIGEPGVGKTAIAEGLAEAIAKGNVPAKLKDKEVYLLDLTSLVAGTQFRGQFENRMKGLIEDIKNKGNVILVIDEVHNLVGAGDAEGSMNAANILKPALSRGEVQVIGATTFAEYRKHIEKDSALERRFQPVTVNEPSIEDSIKIIEGIAHYYEEYHGVTIPKEMCRMAVIMSERYITDRFLPDKAIDLIDEACSDVNLKDKSINRRMELENDLNNIRFEREALQSEAVPEIEGESEADLLEKRYERIAKLRTEEIKDQEELDKLNELPRPSLSVDNFARIIELWTKIPASSIKEDELERLAHLDERLKAHIVGQDEAVDAVCAAIKRSRVGLKTKRKPVSFIFVGGTGVGKTELVKRLAQDMFDSPESLIRLDMSEFMEKFAVSRIIGSPPGYVGYDEAGQLTEKIRRKPYSVVLFDEIEKAHPDVMNILLQILDDGHITDAQGRNVNFENTIVIMTTNAGSNNKGSGSLGFGGTVSDMTRDRSMKALEEFLRPEFINRVDEVICFNQLSEENFGAIAQLMLTELKDVMADKNIDVSWDDEVIGYLVEKGYSVIYGARNLRRLIQKEIEDPLAEQIISFGRKVSSIQIGKKEDKLWMKLN